MDFGVVSHKQTSPTAVCLGSAEPTDEKGHGSVTLKHQRSGLPQDCWKSLKMLKPDDLDFSSDSFAAFRRSNLWPPQPPDDGQTMLSFSSHVTHDGGGSGRNIAFSDESNSRTGSGGLSGGIRGTYSRLKGPFTPSQWMELEHQALIYKHIVANVPIPSNLLVPLKRSLYSYGSYASPFLSWGPFHLGFPGSNDPEPGRCRRTDGKKWRCSRDAVPDQKYCERHINRGRHRSRKPVEGHTGHAVSRSTASKAAPIASSSSASVMSSSRASDTRSLMQHPITSLQPNTCTDHLVTRALKSKDAQFSIQKHVPFEESSQSGFGMVSSDCLLNPSGKISYMSNSNTKGANSQHLVHHFMDDWPKDESDRKWPEELKSDWTQLSMSIPIAPDFSSSSSSPAQEKSTVSTLRLSHEVDPIHMSLGVSQPVEKQSSWSPAIWGNSMGGPLGEVLTRTNSGAGSDVEACRSSPHLGSSPTGVLQKSTFVSLSNTSSAGSPDNGAKAAESVSLCNDLLASALIRSATIPHKC